MKLLMCLILVTTSFSISAVKPVEKSIIDHVETEMKNAEVLLEKVVNINSGTMNFPGVKAVGKHFIDELDDLGFHTEWIDGSKFGRAGHLFASKGNKGVKILLIGHLDTVFASDSNFNHYEVLGDNKVKGPGITDMKGGDVVIIYALKALQSAGVLKDLSVQIVMTGDEEKRGSPYSIANKVIIDAAKWADVAIGFEDGDGNPKTIVVARRGSVGWTLNVKGKPAHSSQIFRDDIGYGAILETARILNSFRESLSVIPNLTFNPGVIVGGTDVELDNGTTRGTAFGKSNVIARSVKVSGGIRALSPEQLANAKKTMQKIVADNLSQTSATLAFSEGYPPMAPRDSNYELLALYNQVSLDLGYGEVKAVNPRLAGAADISLAANYVSMSIDGLGLMGDGGHTDNEIADMNTFAMQIQRAAILMYRLSKQ
ncbi:MAG: M20 family metallopeptidase [Gammaproteobacteria bacterium]|nr:M20 family metallopeptidase [Gammaproteobacteria bacterium]